MVAQVCGLKLGDFVHTLGDAHIYTNHMEQVNEQLSRDIRALPQMQINPNVKDIFSFKFEDFSLENYDPHPAIKGVVAVWFERKKATLHYTAWQHLQLIGVKIVGVEQAN